jgi:dimethylsulfone monooxygenase
VPAKAGIRYGYWMPVFGGWLRNVEDEQMQATWDYTRKLAQRSEKIGYDLSLIAELNLNDIKGVDAPSLDAWSTSAALAAVTESLELMVAVRPTFHTPALFAKQAANIDQISNGRLALNVVSSWWEQEARMYGVDFEKHDDRYGRTSEWLDVVNGAWSQKTFTHTGKYYQTAGTVLEPKPKRSPRPTIYAGGESEAAKNLIALKCDAYVMHGDSPEHVKTKIADMRERREKFGLGPMQFGVAGYAFTRDSDAEVSAEIDRITDVKQNAKGFANYEQWLKGTQLEQKMSIQEYSVSNRGLRSGLVGTPGKVQEQIGKFEEVGVDLLLLQFSPQLEEMERFSDSVIRRN